MNDPEVHSSGLMVEPQTVGLLGFGDSAPGCRGPGGACAGEVLETCPFPSASQLSWDQESCVARREGGSGSSRVVPGDP